MQWQSEYDRWLTTPPDEHNPIVGEDWQGEPIYLTDNDDYFDFEGMWVLDDPYEIAKFVRHYYQKVNTYHM